MKLTETHEHILKMCLSPGKTKREIALMTGIRYESINHHLRRLRAAGYMRMEGYSRSTKSEGIFISVSSGEDAHKVDNVIKRAHLLPYMAHDPFGLARRMDEVKGQTYQGEPRRFRGL